MTIDANRGRRPRVGLVWPDSGRRRDMARALARDGNEVLQAADGPELLRRVGDRFALQSERTPPLDLVVTRDHPGEIDGLQLAATFRQLGWPTPFVTVAPPGDLEVEHRARRIGAVALLERPGLRSDEDLHLLRAAVAQLAAY